MTGEFFTSVAHLPRKARDYHGYIYVIKFSTGIVKVGKARNPQVRIASHATEASRFNASIDAMWCSPEHHNHDATERALIRACLERAQPAAGNEYFSQVPFEAAVESASCLTFTAISDEEIEEKDRQAKQKARALFGSIAPQSAERDEIDDLVRAYFFAKSSQIFKSEVTDDPDDEGISETVLSSLKIIANNSGASIDEALDLCYLDVLQSLMEMRLEVVGKEHRIWALENDRQDLLRSYRDRAGLPPNTFSLYAEPETLEGTEVSIGLGDNQFGEERAILLVRKASAQLDAGEVERLVEALAETLEVMRSA